MCLILKNQIHQVQCLAELEDKEAAEKVARHFSSISQEYAPLDRTKLPAYLPAQDVLQVEEGRVAEQIFKLKSRRSTQPCDIPSQLRKLYCNELAIPMTNIINACLSQNYYPKPWKHEYVVPVEKVSHPTSVKDLRKISLTSEFSLVFERIIKEWLMYDIGPNIDKSQYGNMKGSGTEHMIVCMMD